MPKNDDIVGAEAGLLTLRETLGVPIVDVPTFWQKLTEVEG